MGRHDDVIVHANIQRLADRDERSRIIDILPAGIRITRRMIMGKDNEGRFKKERLADNILIPNLHLRGGPEMDLLVDKAAATAIEKENAHLFNRQRSHLTFKIGSQARVIFSPLILRRRCRRSRTIPRTMKSCMGMDQMSLSA